MSDIGAAPVQEGPSAGALLRQAREAAGLHVSTLAAHLKVPVRKLEALEDDRYEELPDAVFVRGLASSVCRTLKIDPAPVLARLPQTQRPRLAQTADGINAPFRAPNDPVPAGVLHKVSKPVLITVALLLLGALVMIFLPLAEQAYEAVVQANRTGSDTPRATSTVTETSALSAAPAASSVAAAPVAVAAPTAAAPVTQAPPAAQPPQAVSTANPPASASSGMQLQAGSSTPVAAASSASAPAAAASAPDEQGVVVFRARAQSWVQVKDARGVTVMQRLMAPGETAGASGALPLSVVVGSAQSTDVQVRGKPLDLAPLVRDNVARFEVK